jgi:Uri superfamily endonuclease
MIEIILMYLLLFLPSNSGSIGAIKRSKWLTIYPNGKLNPKLLLDYTKRQNGVYLIKYNGEIVYIGYSAGSLYKTITRHFQSWKDRTQTRVTYPQNEAYKVRVVFTRTGSQAAELERALILKYRPRDNPNKYENYLFSKDEKNTITEIYDQTEAPF